MPIEVASDAQLERWSLVVGLSSLCRPLAKLQTMSNGDVHAVEANGRRCLGKCETRALKTSSTVDSACFNPSIEQFQSLRVRPANTTLLRVFQCSTRPPRTE